MAPTNLDFLQDSLKYLGFGEKSILNEHLTDQVKREQPSFELFTEAFYNGDTKLEAKLYFSRSATSGFYYFNKYYALLRYADTPDKERAQTFFINKGQGITFKEAFNLLQGRAVFKTLTSKSGIQYTSWLQLDFTLKTQGGNYYFKYFRGRRFDLEKALEKHNIREMGFDTLRATLIRSLQRGNMHPVTIDGPEYFGRHFIEANPAMETINFYPTATRAAEKTLAPGEEVHDPEETDAEPASHSVLDEETHPASESRA
ncbi:hypothetical protein [Puia dinghuensis]|uniref:Uncharacterized protein n=1 Tax=Puia dinghuensis TaxID=1792502 RepID=A0A8J2XPW9_9BACT|nr:hypothetical protein [Puia dinghuensis]GGA82290.1 hypothetical protein GCM10011511_01570 [Puia dinghuensis]